MRFVPMPVAVAAMAISIPASPAQAQSTWACEVLLCISNPGGATQFTECVAPIRKLITSLATGHPFPTCSGGDVRSTRYVKPRNGREGRVTLTYNDGRHETYVVPLESQLPLDGQGAATQQ
jgi:hypothetical protein